MFNSNSFENTNNLISCLFPSPDINNLAEITWENGQIIMKPQSNIKPPNNTGYKDFNVKDLSNTDVSWLTSYPSTDDYCTEFLSGLTRGNTNTNTNFPLLHDGSNASDKATPSTSEHHTISISNPNQLQTQDPTTTSRFLNFTRPGALHKTNFQNTEKPKTSNPIDNASVKWDEKSIIRLGKEKKVLECLPEKLPSEMIATSSSLCSNNRMKRTITEGDDLCYQSEVSILYI